MVIAVGQRDGRQVLYVGLEQENIDRLLNDQPIFKSLDEFGLEGWDMAIMGPEDVARFVARYARE